MIVTRLTPYLSWVIHKQGEKKVIQNRVKSVGWTIYEILKPETKQDDKMLAAKGVDPEKVLDRLFQFWLDEPAGRQQVMDLLDDITQTVTDKYDTYEELKADKPGHPLVKLVEKHLTSTKAGQFILELSTKYGETQGIREELLARFIDTVIDEMTLNNWKSTKKYSRDVENMVNS